MIGFCEQSELAYESNKNGMMIRIYKRRNYGWLWLFRRYTYDLNIVGLGMVERFEFSSYIDARGRAANIEELLERASK